MSLSQRTFRRIFERVCDDYALSRASRRAAWASCVKRSTDGKPYLDSHAVRCYTILDRTAQR
jgi:hypothetical protein